MSLKSAMKELFKKAEDIPAEVKHGSLTSTRLWVLVGFVALLIWMRLPVQEIVRYSFLLAITYIAANTLTKMTSLIVNGLIRRDMIRQAYKDGKLDATEAAAISEPTKV